MGLLNSKSEGGSIAQRCAWGPVDPPGPAVCSADYWCCSTLSGKGYEHTGVALGMYHVACPAGLEMINFQCEHW